MRQLPRLVVCCVDCCDVDVSDALTRVTPGTTCPTVLRGQLEQQGAVCRAGLCLRQWGLQHAVQVKPGACQHSLVWRTQACGTAVHPAGCAGKVVCKSDVVPVTHVS
jgi:hypothetical protein